MAAVGPADMKTNLSKGLLILGCFTQRSPSRSNLHPNSVSQGFTWDAFHDFLFSHFLFMVWTDAWRGKCTRSFQWPLLSSLLRSPFYFLSRYCNKANNFAVESWVVLTRKQLSARDGQKRDAKLSELTFRPNTVVAFAIVVACVLFHYLEKRWKVFRTMANSTWQISSSSQKWLSSLLIQGHTHFTAQKGKKPRVSRGEPKSHISPPMENYLNWREELFWPLVRRFDSRRLHSLTPPLQFNTNTSQINTYIHFSTFSLPLEMP